MEIGIEYLWKWKTAEFQPPLPKLSFAYGSWQAQFWSSLRWFNTGQPLANWHQHSLKPLCSLRTMLGDPACTVVAI